MKMKKVPMRRCVGCMQSRPKKELIRIVGTPEGPVVLDRTGKARGRGAYLCSDGDCLAKARKRNALARSLGRSIDAGDLDRIYGELTNQ